ncbi:MAG: aquaporin family protein [Mesorhizobium sp.]|nr:MIP/aquaporin family protein [Mesorhizobium sp.]MBL8577720.1 aquaporin family protein [Mesorhizobium sp.]
MDTFSLSRRMAAESAGTGLLVAAVVGSGIMADRLTDDVALALLCNAIATGAALAVLISVLGPLSGAHFNPAVSLAFAFRGELPMGELAGYVTFQVLGGLAGTMVAHAMFDLPILEVGTTARSGWPQWFSEGVATFGLVALILIAVRVARPNVAWLVGLYITAAYWFTSSTSFANPAVTVARAFTDTFAGIRPTDVPAFVIAQLAGALLALIAAGWLLRPATRAV